MTIEPFWVQVSDPALRQGDFLPRCLVPIPGLDFATENGPREGVAIEYDLIVLTQSCDLEQRKVRLVTPIGKSEPGSIVRRAPPNSGPFLGLFPS